LANNLQVSDSTIQHRLAVTRIVAGIARHFPIDTSQKLSRKRTAAWRTIDRKHNENERFHALRQPAKKTERTTSCCDTRATLCPQSCRQKKEWSCDIRDAPSSRFARARAVLELRRFAARATLRQQRAATSTAYSVAQ
jgi:hypothetical protein